MGDDWKTAATANDRFQAEMLVAMLGEAGIPAMIRADDVGGWVPSMLQMRGVAVLVPVDLVVAAEAVIGAANSVEEE